MSVEDYQRQWRGSNVVGSLKERVQSSTFRLLMLKHKLKLEL